MHQRRAHVPLTQPGEPYTAAQPSDEALIRRLRDGYGSGTADVAAGDLLYRRHRAAALAYALTCCRRRHDAEDLVSEAYLRTLQAVRAGTGPRGAWRPYLLAVVRHTAMEWSAGERHTLPVPDAEALRPRFPMEADPQARVLAGEDLRMLVRGFRALPERWQTVLWRTLVEEDSPHEVAALLGLSPSGVSSLALRAREGLREAYLRAHAGRPRDGLCRHFGALLGTAVRRGGTKRVPGLARHLAACSFCTRVYGELLGVNAAMRAPARPRSACRR